MEEFKPTQESQENLEGVLQEVYNLIENDLGISLDKEKTDPVEVEIKGNVSNPDKTFTLEFNATRGDLLMVLKHEIGKELTGFEGAKLLSLSRKIITNPGENGGGGYKSLKTAR